MKSASANIALIKSVTLLTLLCLSLIGTGCTPAQLMGPTTHRDWEIQERNLAPKACPAPWVEEEGFYKLQIRG